MIVVIGGESIERYGVFSLESESVWLWGRPLRTESEMLMPQELLGELAPFACQCGAA